MCLYEDMSRRVESFVEHVEGFMGGGRLAPLDVNLDISGFKLNGRIAGMYPERLLHYRYAKVRPKDHLCLWVCHLALHAMETEHYSRTSLLAALHPTSGQPHLWEYLPVENSKEILGELLDKYWMGLMKPLHFFPEASWHYLHMLVGKKNPREEALRSARNTWFGSDFKRGECEDLSYRLCFQGTDPLDHEFADLAMEVLGPLLSHLHENGA
jgi:exodeoxyribonuclease V gamma subunit